MNPPQTKMGKRPHVIPGARIHWDDVCALHWVWSEARTALVDKLKDATLADMSQADLALLAGKAPVPKDSHRKTSS